MRWSAILSSMVRIVPGIVRGGQVVLDDNTLELADGTPVRVVVIDQPDDFVLTPEQESELEAALAEADRGEGVPWEEARARLLGKHE